VPEDARAFSTLDVHVNEHQAAHSHQHRPSDRAHSQEAPQRHGGRRQSCQPQQLATLRVGEHATGCVQLSRLLLLLWLDEG
jgi:hypothetical protein